MEPNAEDDHDHIVIHGPEFVSSTRFGGVAFAPVPESHSQFTVQKLDEVGAISQRQLDLMEQIREKADAQPSSLLTPVTLNLDDGGLSWIAWESSNWPTIAKLLSDCERRHSRKAVTLENFARIFREVAVTIDGCRERGWQSPEIDLSLERTYVVFESDPSPSELWRTAKTDFWPQFKIKFVPYCLNYLFPLSDNPGWHEKPFLLRYATFIYEALGGKTEEDGVPRLQDYRGGLISMGQGANSYLRSTLNVSEEGMEKLCQLSAEEWLKKLLEADGLGEMPTDDFTKPTQHTAPVSPLPQKPEETETQEVTKSKAPLAFGAGIATVVIGGVLFFMMSGPRYEGDTDSMIADAIVKHEAGDSKQAVDQLIFAAEIVAQTPEDVKKVLEIAFTMKSEKAAEKLAEIEKEEAPGSAVGRYRAIAEWCRDQSRDPVDDRGFTEIEALAAAAGLGDGLANLELGKLYQASNQAKEAQAVLSNAATILQQGNAVTAPDLEKAAETHEILFRTYQSKTSYDWLIAIFRESDPARSAALAESASEFSLASTLYTEAGHYDKAAAAAIRGEDFEGAETSYLLGGFPDLAVAMWEQRSEIERAAGVWLKTDPVDEEKAKAVLMTWAKKSEPAQAINLLRFPLLSSDVGALYELAKLQGEHGNIEDAKLAYSTFVNSFPEDDSTWDPEWSQWRAEAVSWQSINDPNRVDKKEIQRLIAAKNFREASDIYERAGKLGEAAQIWLEKPEPNMPSEAVSIYGRAALHDKAVSIWEIQGEYAKVVEYWNQVPDPAKAISYAMTKGVEIEASDPGQASALYEGALAAGETEAHFRIGRTNETLDAQKSLDNYSAFAIKLETLSKEQWRETWTDLQEQSVRKLAAIGGADWVHYLAGSAPMAGEQGINILKEDPKTMGDAALVLEKLQRLEEAATTYLEAKQTDKGTELLIQLGRLSEAADAYVNAGQKEKGISLLLEATPAQTIDKQIPLYEKVVSLGDPEGHYHLGKIEEESRANPQQAAERYWNFFNQLGSMSRDAWRPNWANLRQDAVTRGNNIDPVRFGDPVLLEQAKELPLPEGVQFLLAREKVNLAGQLYLDANQPDQAIKLYSENQLFEEAANLLTSLNRIEEAADMWVAAGMPGKAHRLLIDTGKEQSDLQVAQRLFDKVVLLGSPEGHFLVAKLVYEPAENLTAAADRYLRFIQELSPIPQESWDPTWPAMRASAFERVKVIGTADSLQQLANQTNVPQEKQDLLWQAHQIWQTGNASTQKDADKADNAFRDAAVVGHPVANQLLGVRSEEAEDWPNALRFFTVAADQPIGATLPQENQTAIAVSAEKAGMLYHHVGGEKPGITKDTGEAIRLFEIAANAGLADSMYHLGVIHADIANKKEDASPGTAKEELSKALAYYEAAAAAGNAQAAVATSFIYSGGRTPDGKVDLQKALELMKRAKELGHPSADNLIKVIMGLIEKANQ